MKNGGPARRIPFTWDDYRRWDDDQRWEIVNGEAFAMAPAPTPRHQMVVGELFKVLASFFRGKICRPLPSPIDVKLSDLDVLQPDIVVVCDPAQIRPTHIEGAPRLVVEVLSDSTEQRDRGAKMDAYARAGVFEVWLVTPWPPCVEVFALDGDAYRRVAAYTQTQSLRSVAFPGLVIALAPVFNFPLAPGEELPAAREPPSPRYAAPPENG